MSFLSKLLGAGDVVRAVGDSLDKLFTSDDERNEKRLEIVKAERDFSLAALQIIGKSDEKQADVNIEEIRSGSVFMAGWRPAIGWIGVVALGYQFVVYPFLLWFAKDAPPALDATTLFTMVTGMLGVGAMRSFDKMQETDTQIIGKAPGK